jgi:hypothetical protein
VAHSSLYFHGDLLHKAILSERITALAFSMQNLRALEQMTPNEVKREASLFKKILTRVILEPFGWLVLFLLEKAAR